MATAASAHHAITLNYDPNSSGEVEGVVEEVFWANPHVHYYLTVTEASRLIGSGQLSPVTLVEAFLARRIGFLDIVRTVAATLDAAEGRGLVRPVNTLAEVLAADAEGRRLAQDLLHRYV